jgi:hypothetical protein
VAALSWLWRNRAYLALIVVSIFLVGRGQLQSEDIADGQDQIKALTRANHNLVTSLQHAIVEACEKIGNERAKATREQLNEEIREAQAPDPALLNALDLPPSKVDELIAENVAKLKERLAKVKLADCAKQYQISPGSGDRRRAGRSS